MTRSVARPRWSVARTPGGWTVLDAAIALGFLVLLVTEITPNPDMTPHVPLLAASSVLALSLAWRRAYPASVGVIVCVASLVLGLVATGEFAPQLAILPVLVALYTAASLTRGGRAVLAGVVTALLNAAAWIGGEQGEVDDFWPWMLWGGAWAAGTFVRRREDVAAQHAARAALLEVEARTAAVESAQAERDRIARELHDVVAHSVSVMVVQAGAERLRLGPDGGRTAAALAAIEESGRTALGELRAMLGVLRDGSDEELAPLPGLATLPALVDQVRAAGLPVELTVHPASALETNPALGSSAGLAAYRIVQEALTNVIRHEGLVPTRVHVDLAGASLSLTVSNDTQDRSRPEPRPGGRGILGMRERATALGGSFEVGRADGEYVVRARLPVRAGAAT